MLWHFSKKFCGQRRLGNIQERKFPISSEVPKTDFLTETLRVDGKIKGQGEKCPRAWKKDYMA